MARHSQCPLVRPDHRVDSRQIVYRWHQFHLHEERDWCNAAGYNHCTNPQSQHTILTPQLLIVAGNP